MSRSSRGRFVNDTVGCVADVSGFDPIPSIDDRCKYLRILEFEGGLYQFPARYTCLLIAVALTFKELESYFHLNSRQPCDQAGNECLRFERVSRDAFRNSLVAILESSRIKKPSKGPRRVKDCDIKGGRSQL